MKAKVIASFVGAALAASAWAAIPTGAGPYYWADYLPTNGGRADARPESALEADQTWIVETDRTAKPFYPGVQTLNDYWQIWTGGSVTSLSGDGFRVMKGNVVFENAVISKTTENYIGYTGPVKLLLRKGGSFLATADNVRIGNAYNGGTAGTATVFMEEPSSFAVADKWFAVGNNLPGALWMDGGLFAMTNGIFYVGDKEGYVRLNGGKISLRAESQSTLVVGNGAAYGSMHVSGGELATRKSAYPSETYVEIGPEKSTAAEFYMDAGKVSLANERFLLGRSKTAGSTATLTLDGTADFNVGIFVMGRSTAGIKTTLNLNGGSFSSSKGLSTYGQTGPTRQINLNGGTIAGPMDASWPTTVYPQGGVVNVTSSKKEIKLSPKLATGYGVSAIELTSAGSGYVTAPQVTISGGAGHGASGYAVLAKDRTIERVVVTCRGEGYLADDELTVAFSSTTGSGVAATVKLDENTPGTLRKIGAGTWQQSGDSAFDGDISIDEGAIAVDGVSMTSLKHLYVRNGAALNVGRSLNTTDVRSSSVNRVDVKDALAEIGRYGDSGRGKLTIGELHVDRGLLLVTRTNDLELALTDASPSATSASASPIVSGMVYRHGDASAYRSPSLFERGEDGTLSLVTTTAKAENDANFCPSASNKSGDAPKIDSLNCAILPLSPGVECYLKNTGLLEIKSGMIVCRRPHECVVRLEVTGGGAFTTRAPGGMTIYSDMYQVSRRSYSQAHGSVVNVGNWRRMYGPFADPDASTPMALTIAGERQSRPELGAVAWLLSKNGFSGGLNLINGGVVVGEDEALGKAGAPIDAIGNCSITAREWTFAIGARPLTIHEDAALMFCPSYGNQGNTVGATLMGTGDLLTSDIDRSGYAIAYTGDHSAFEGIYYIMGHARISPETFGPRARIFLADGTNGVGVVETSGEITRPFGLMTPGAVAWHKHRSMPAEYGLRGGFAAKGGDLTVNLGGEGAALVSGTDYLPAGAVIQLQSQYADSALTVMNGLDLCGKTQTVSVWSGKSAMLAGELKDSVGGGALKVTGGGTLVFGGTIRATVNADGTVSAPLALDGNLTLDGAKIVIEDPNDVLKTLAGRSFPLVTCTGTLTGKFTCVCDNGMWSVRTTAGGATLKERSGSLVILK